MVPPFPPNVRFAIPDDLTRLSLVGAAGYADAPQTPYVRPYAKDWPGDTVGQYYAGYRRDLVDPRGLVLVVEDELDLNEKDKVAVHFRSLWPEYGQGDGGRKVVVAVTSLTLPESCGWVRERKEKGVVHDIPEVECERRDQNKEGARQLGGLVGALIKENTKDKATINTMVLHPAYKGKRHGDSLLKWILDFLAEQGLSYYLAATPDGKKLYLRHGAREVDFVEVPGYSEHPNSFRVFLMQWDPKLKS